MLLLGITVLVSQQTPNSVSSRFIRPYFVVPLLFLAAMRFGSWGASSATLVVSLVAVWFAAQGRRPIPRADVSITIQMLAAQALLLALVLMTLAMVAVFEERTRAREQLELVILGTDAGIWGWNLLTNEVYQSPRWKSILGFGDHELPSRFEAWESRIHLDDHSRALATFRDFLAEKRDNYELEHRLRHRDGTNRWVLSRGLMVRDTTGRPVRVAGSHLDITAIKKVEESLRESERHFSAAFDDSPIAMDLVDLRGR